MTLSALGIFSAAGAGGAAFSSDYELIETVILGSSQSSVTFSSLGTYFSTYKHLQFRLAVRGDRAATSEGMIINVNGDFGSNYNSHVLEANGSSVISSSATVAFWDYHYIASASATANVFSGVIVDLLDAYSTTKNKTKRAMSAGLADNYLQFSSGLWRNTAALSSVTFDVRYGTNFVAGSRFSLYGIRG